MGKLRTPEQLQLIFQKEKEKRLLQKQKEKQLQQQKYKKAAQEIKKELRKKHKQELQQNNNQKPPTFKYKITYTHNPLIERETAYTDLYSKEELINIETLYPEEIGRINWNKFYELVEITKNWIKQYNRCE